METLEYIDHIKKSYPMGLIREIISKFRGTKVIVIGDAIIDEYHFTLPKGRAIKDPILSVDFVRHEAYLGGILAIANHVSNFVDEVTCVTAIGDREDKRDFITNTIKKNVRFKFFVKGDSPTTLKKRYLNIVHNEKMFKVEYINDAPVSGALEQEIIAFLEAELPKYDIVLVGDFGHGLITDNVIRIIEKKSNYLAVNSQSNSANLGFNYITRYHEPDFAAMDTQELMYAVEDRFSEIPAIMDKLYHKAGFKKFLVTLSKDGSCYFNEGSKIFSPAFVMRPQDTVGAGDAVFSVASLFAYSNHDELVPFIANCAGGIAVSYMGNKESITKEGLLEFIEQVYKGDKKVN